MERMRPDPRDPRSERLLQRASTNACLTILFLPASAAPLNRSRRQRRLRALPQGRRLPLLRTTATGLDRHADPGIIGQRWIAPIFFEGRERSDETSAADRQTRRQGRRIGRRSAGDRRPGPGVSGGGRRRHRRPGAVLSPLSVSLSLLLWCAAGGGGAGADRGRARSRSVYVVPAAAAAGRRCRDRSPVRRRSKGLRCRPS